MKVTPAGRLQRDRVALRGTLDSVLVAARYWRNAPDDPERRRKFIQLANLAERRALALEALANQADETGQADTDE